MKLKHASITASAALAGALLAGCQRGTEGYAPINLDAHGKGTMLLFRSSLTSPHRIMFEQAQSENVGLYTTVPFETLPPRSGNITLTLQGAEDFLQIPCKVRGDDVECPLDFSKAQRSATAAAPVPTGYVHRR